jgi:6-pyruvoyltetrahydropterin/6-carboxytetrahydropterin synthase
MKLDKVLEQLDHKYLNHTPYFKKVNPTSENIAKYIYERIRRLVPSVKSVTVWENNTSSATYEA